MMEFMEIAGEIAKIISYGSLGFLAIYLIDYYYGAKFISGGRGKNNEL